MQSDEGLRTPLHLAAENGCYGICYKLLCYGANPNSGMNSGDIGFTPMHIAAQHDKYDVIQLLIGFGASVNCVSRKNGITPLHTAVLKKNDKTIEILVINGANPQAIDKKFNTPEDLSSNVKHIKALLHPEKETIDTDVSDSTISRPTIMIFMEHSNSGVFQILKKYLHMLASIGYRDYCFERGHEMTIDQHIERLTYLDANIDSKFKDNPHPSNFSFSHEYEFLK